MSLTARADNLSNVVERWVVRLWNVNLPLFLWWLVVWRCDIGRVHSDDFIDKAQAFLVVFVFESLLPRVLPQASFAVINGFW